MPKNLDYMFYSGKYFIEDRGNIKGNFKELIIHLLTMYDYDYIIFDTPPICVVGDAAIVASFCDGALLVVENGVTKKKTLAQMKSEMDKVGANVIGVVQNMVGSKKDSSYYGKGNYGYYYGKNQNKK